MSAHRTWRDRQRLRALRALATLLTHARTILQGLAVSCAAILVVTLAVQTQDWEAWGDLADLFGASRYAAHSLCLSSDPIIIRMFVGADASIAMAYYLIAFILWRVHSDPLRIMRAVVVVMRDPIFIKLFAWFILGCGSTHLTEVLTLYSGVYRLDVLARLLTAAVSVVTAFRLIMIAVQSDDASILGEIGAVPVPDYESRPLSLHNPAVRRAERQAGHGAGEP